MYRRQAILFPLMLTVMLALLTFWINQTVENNSAKMDGSNRHDHDYVLNNFHTTKTDLLGNLHYVLAATQMEHFPDDDTSVLQRPRFTQYTINKPYTQISGLRGYVSSDGEEVQIVDNVIVVRPASADKGEMQMLTDRLTIYPKQEIATTNSAVIIKQFPKTEIHATGLLLNKKEQTITLGALSDNAKRSNNALSTRPARVRVHYERPVAVQKSTVVKAVTPTTQSKASKIGLPSKKNTSKPTQRVRRSYE